MHSPIVGIVIVNWKDEQDTLACLSSLVEIDYPEKLILVVDNGSPPEAIGHIREQFPTIPILSMGENTGYTGGNNAGIEWMLRRNAEWILLLNNDTTVDKKLLLELVGAGEEDPRIGIVGPTVYYSTSRNVIQSAGGILDHNWQAFHRGSDLVDQGQFSSPEDVDWISGCAIMARSKLIYDVGLLDQRFFAYQEELEWCIRARQKGWRAVHVPKAKIWHSGVNQNDSPKPYVTYYMTRNWLLILKEYQVSIGVWGHAVIRTFRTLLSWTLLPKWRCKNCHRDAMWKAVIDFLQNKFGPTPI